MHSKEGASKWWWVGISEATKENQENSGYPLSKSRQGATKYLPVLHTVTNILET